MLRTENQQIRRDQKVVLADVTLDVRPGEVLGVLGPFPLAQSLLIQPHMPCGRRQLPAQRHPQFLQVPTQRLAVLPQTSTLDFAFRVEVVVGMGRLPHQTGRTRDAEIIHEALDRKSVV